MDRSDEMKYIEDIDNRYCNSETEEGLIIRRLLAMYLREKKINLEKTKALDNLVDNSRRDELTGLYNRKAIVPYFRNTLNSADPIDQNTSFSIITIDLDHFKSVNDTYGHNVGDDVLRIVAEGLIRTFKKRDLIVRDGGDEFLVVVKNCDLSILVYKTEVMSNYITECIHKELNDKVNEFGMPITRPHEYTISFGIREMDISKLKDINDDDEFKSWFKDEKEYADKAAYVQKDEHHSVRR